MTVLPMFPLGTALLPGAVLPLRVFEPRYRALVRHCVEVGPPEFGVVLIARGFEVGGGDQRTDVGTVARITRLAPFQDGTFALEVVGTRRIRVVGWRPDDPFPLAVVEDWPDDPPSPGWEDGRDAVAAHVRRVFALGAARRAHASPRSRKTASMAAETSRPAARLALMALKSSARLLKSSRLYGSTISRPMPLPAGEWMKTSE